MRPSASPTLSLPTLFPFATATLRIALFAILFACCAQPAFAANQTVGPTDSRLSFKGSWTSQGNGEWQFTADATASVSFTFTGSAIYYRGMEDPNGALNVISVDGGGSTTIDQSNGLVANADTVRDVVLFSKSGLDGTQQHTIQVSYGGPGGLGGIYLAFFGFYYDDSPGSGSSNSATSPGNGPSNSATSPQTVTQIVTQTTLATYTPPTTTLSSTTQTTPHTTSVSNPTGTSAPPSSYTTMSSATSTTSNLLILSATNETISGPTTRITAGASVATQLLSTSTTVSDGHLVTVTATQMAGSDTPVLAPSTPSANAKSGQNNTGMVGGILGGVLGAIILTGFVMFILLRRRLHSKEYIHDVESKQQWPSDDHAENNGLRHTAQILGVHSDEADAAGSASDGCESSASESTSPTRSPLRVANPTFDYRSHDAPLLSASKTSAIARAHALASQTPQSPSALGDKTSGVTRAHTLASQASLSTIEDDVHASGSFLGFGWAGVRPSSLGSMPEVAPPVYTERPT